MKKFKDVIKQKIESDKREMEILLKQLPWVISSIEQVAVEFREESKKQTDEDLRKMYADDSHDMLQLAKALEEKRYQAAVDQLFNLDTAPREYIPTPVYNTIIKLYNTMGLR